MSPLTTASKVKGVSPEALEKIVYFVWVLYPKDGAIIELKLCYGYALSCPPVQPPSSQSQLSAYHRLSLTTVAV